MADLKKHFNNVPMTPEDAERVENVDNSWTGPKLIALVAIALGSALVLLWMMANNIIGPTIHQ